MKVETLPPIEEESGVTPWFPEGTIPARPGVYQRDYRSGAGVVRFAYWTGHNWLMSHATAQAANDHADRMSVGKRKSYEVSPVRHVPWRGLTEAEFHARCGAVPS